MNSKIYDMRWLGGYFWNNLSISEMMTSINTSRNDLRQIAQNVHVVELDYLELIPYGPYCDNSLPQLVLLCMIDKYAQLSIPTGNAATYIDILIRDLDPEIHQISVSCFTTSMTAYEHVLSPGRRLQLFWNNVETGAVFSVTATSV